MIDDLNREAFSNPYLGSLFDRVCHHCHCGITAISQSTFYNGKFFRHAMLNATYLVLMSYARDKRAPVFLNELVFPDNSGLIQSAYKDAVETERYGHLLIDTSPYHETTLTLRSRIFSAEQFFHVPVGLLSDFAFANLPCYDNRQSTNEAACSALH